MKSMWQEATRREMNQRLARLTAETPARWGTMTSPTMVAHVIQSFRSAFGDLAVAPKHLPLRFTPLKQFIVYWMPFPRNAPTAPELLAKEPGDWADDVAELAALLNRFAIRDPRDAWPEHAAFGRLSGGQWGVLMYRHADHHFRQFGI